MKKKTTSIILIILCVLLLASCGEKEQEHVHEWDAGKVTVQPTLYEEGVRLYTCTGCGETREESIEKIKLEAIEVPSGYDLPYVVCVNRYMNYVVVYEKDDDGLYRMPVRADSCSCGGEDTPVGEFFLGVRWEWATLIQSMYGQYTTRIEGDILFHSVPYGTKYDPSTLIEGEYNKLGTTASHGCVRLTVEAAKWIYENCVKGTLCVIVDNNKSCPIEKTPILKIHDQCGWDPTDKDPKNPWLLDENYGLPDYYKSEVEIPEPEVVYNYEKVELEGLGLHEMDEATLNLYNKAREAYVKVRLNEWNYGEQRTDLKSKILDFSSFAEAENYLRQYFTKDFTDSLIDYMQTTWEIEEDENGLWSIGPSGKGNIYYSWKPTGYAFPSDIQMLMEIQTTEIDFVDEINWEEYDKVYTYDLFHLLKESDGWKFTEFSLPQYL